jgi:hypothetical protein
MKRPAFQFYPADWRKDAALQSCSIGARGLWHELLCVMHECAPYGHLCINGSPVKEREAARLCGVTLNEYAKLLVELWGAGVPSVTTGGIMFSRRMVKDEHIRTVRAEAGKQGGNPNLLGNKVKQNGKDDDYLLNQVSNQGLTPSSSASALSSTSVEKPIVAPLRSATRLSEDWRLPAEWKEWALQVHPEWSAEGVVRVSIAFRDYWIAKAGKDARKQDWLATWRTWVRRTDAEPVR